MSFYNDSNPIFSNAETNSVGSEYASTYGHNIALTVQKLTNRKIFNSSPKQFMDLRLFNEVPVESINSDEFMYQEMGYQREALVATASAAATTYPAVQTISVQSVDFIATNTIIVYPDSSLGVVTLVDDANLQIQVTPYVGETVPAVASNDIIANMSPVDHDGSEGFAQHFRAQVVERNNYVQLFNMAIRYGEVELHKLRNAGTTDNFLELQREMMYNQHRINLSNAFWLGKKGEVTLKNGQKAKTTQGIFPAMVQAGCPSASVTATTLVSGFEDVVFASEYGDYGTTRMAFMTPRVHRFLSMAYKEELTRYQPNDEIALLNLKEVNLGSSRIVLVPYKRFEDAASFPAAFRNRIVIVDMKNITRMQLWGERSGTTPDLNSNGTPKRYKDEFVDCNMGIKFNNPLACAYVDIQGL